jgi:hypothetical protein
MVTSITLHVRWWQVNLALGRFRSEMSLAMELQPDQKPERWNDHVAVYEEVLDPLTNAFANRALAQKPQAAAPDRDSGRHCRA